MLYARQSTAIIVTVGPVLDADGVAVTDCVVGDFKASKNGGAPAALNASATLTHRNTGHYSLSLTITDVNTVGTLEIVIDDTVNACPMKEIQVIEPAVYDRDYADAAVGYISNQPVDVNTIKTQTVTCAAGVTVSPFVGNATAAILVNASGHVSRVVLADTTTNLTNLPSIPANWLTAAGINDGAFTAAKFASGAFDAVWSVAARILTAGTNIVLAKGTGVTGFNDLSAAQVESECNDALVALNLDHLIKNAVDTDFFTTVHLDSVLGHIVDGGSTNTFDRTTDSLEALRDRGDAAWVTATSVTVSDKTGFKLASDGLALVTTWTVDLTGNITGNLSGSVGSVTGAVGSVTGNVGGNVTGSVGSVTGAVGSVTGNVGGNVTGSVGSLAAQAKADVNAEVLDVLNVDTLVDGKTIAQALIYCGAGIAGRVSGAGTGTEVFLGFDESTTRLTVTVDSSGNRTDIAYG